MIGTVAINYPYLKENEKRSYIIGVLAGLGIAIKMIGWGFFRMDYEVMRLIIQGYQGIDASYQILLALNSGNQIRNSSHTFSVDDLLETNFWDDKEAKAKYFRGLENAINYMMGFAWRIKSASSEELAMSESISWGKDITKYIMKKYGIKIEGKGEEK